MSAHDEAVAAAAHILRAEWFQHCGKRLFIRVAIRICAPIITAYLSHLRAAGLVVARVPKNRTMPGPMGTEAAFDYASGWNACRAAMLEGDKP